MLLWFLFVAYIASIAGVGACRPIGVKAACLLMASIITVVASLIT